MRALLPALKGRSDELTSLAFKLTLKAQRELRGKSQIKKLGRWKKSHSVLIFTAGD